jgi:carbonic anhydrase/acetyltransferase-like protein (isoleucine patch superfamily)
MKEMKFSALKYKVIPFGGKAPQVQATFVAPNCFLIGDVVLKEESSVWFGSTLRGDLTTCQIGRGSVIMEHSFVENSIIGDGTMLSHGVIVHQCKIGNNVLVGIGARVINGAEIGDNSIVGAGAFILSKIKIPSNSVVIDKGTVLRTIEEKDIRYIQESVKAVQEKARALRELLEREPIRK